MSNQDAIDPDNAALDHEADIEEETWDERMREAIDSRDDHEARPAVKGGLQSKTFSMLRLSKRELERGRALYPDEGVRRPKLYSECQAAGLGTETPCPFVSCKWHLYLDVSESGLAIKINHPNIDPTEMKHTCTLAVANVGGVTLYEVGKIINITRERVRQIEAFALAQLTSTAIKDHE